ncbi:MAG: serine/threonine protein phosphatase 1 [Candidatus Paceibacteria bacterium]|jgi:serine/threonine protein phosphatase 1
MLLSRVASLSIPPRVGDTPSLRKIEMTTWIVGDIHGCADEFDQLLQRLGASPSDSIISCGDLFHRGPDPAGVMDLMTDCNAQFILGNHERTVLKRIALDPQEADGSDRPSLRVHFPTVVASDLDGDGHEPCHIPVDRRREFLVFLQTHEGYFLRSDHVDGAASVHDARQWAVVHAGVLPDLALEDHSPYDLTRTTRLKLPDEPWWYERYEGDDLLLYGHTSDKLPRIHRSGSRMNSLCLDTACVYGGSLTAYSPDLDELVSVQARKSYAA